MVTPEQIQSALEKELQSLGFPPYRKPEGADPGTAGWSVFYPMDRDRVVLWGEPADHDRDDDEDRLPRTAEDTANRVAKMTAISNHLNAVGWSTRIVIDPLHGAPLMPILWAAV